MKLFIISQDDVIRTGVTLWTWDADLQKFLRTITPQDAESQKYTNAIYKHGNFGKEYEAKPGDLIEIQGGGLDGELFTIIGTSVVNLWQLFDVSQKVQEGLNTYAISMSSDRYYQPYKIIDLTQNSPHRVVRNSL